MNLFSLLFSIITTSIQFLKIFHLKSHNTSILHLPLPHFFPIPPSHFYFHPSSNFLFLLKKREDPMDINLFLSHGYKVAIELGISSLSFFLASKGSQLGEQDPETSSRVRSNPGPCCGVPHVDQAAQLLHVCQVTRSLPCMLSDDSGSVGPCGPRLIISVFCPLPIFPGPPPYLLSPFSFLHIVRNVILGLVCFT